MMASLAYGRNVCDKPSNKHDGTHEIVPSEFAFWPTVARLFSAGILLFFSAYVPLSRAQKPITQTGATFVSRGFATVRLTSDPQFNALSSLTSTPNCDGLTSGLVSDSRSRSFSAFPASFSFRPQLDRSFPASHVLEPARPCSRQSDDRAWPPRPRVPPSLRCSGQNESDLIEHCDDPPSFAFVLWRSTFPSPADALVPPEGFRHDRFDRSAAITQSLEFLLVEHGFRLAQDPYLRYLLFHKPFWHDYFASANDFDMNRWGDGDDFLVNYIGHPLEGSVSGNIFLQNDPVGRESKFGRSSAYWKSRFEAAFWAAAYSAYFEIGPVLSETAIGNEGGYTYVPDCGRDYPSCEKPGRTYKPPTNNTGWVDFIVTPTVGMGWIVLEDFLEADFVDRIAKGSPALKFKIMRGALAPSHTMSNLLAGRLPWYRYSPHLEEVPVKGAPWQGEPRIDLGIHLLSLSLPMDREGCGGCRANNLGIGFDFGSRLTRLVYFDSEFNVFPGSGSAGEKGTAQEGLFGVRAGRSVHSWGIYLQVRPGFIHYDKSLIPGTTGQYESVTRFALDLGGSMEYRASRRSAIRLSLGTTLVRYLTNHPDPMQPPVSVLSPDYIATQGNFHLGTAYIFRF
jgi:hypothetical protein